MAVLKLSAINLDHCAGVANQAFSNGFHQASFTGAGRTEEEEIADGAAGAIHSREVRLIGIYDLIDRLVLPHDPFV